MSESRASEASPPKKYRLRVDVAKPAELYKPTFGSSRTSPSVSTKGSVSGTPLAPEEAERRASEPPMMRSVEGGKRNRKPVDRMPAGGVDVAAAPAGSSSADRGGGEGNGARIIQRILSRRVHEGGSTSYLVVWGNGHVTSATWHSRASLGHANAPLLQQFDAAVKRVRLMGMRELEMAASSLSSLGLPHATYFQGISSKSADGSIRRAASPATLPTGSSGKGARDRSKDGKPRSRRPGDREKGSAEAHGKVTGIGSSSTATPSTTSLSDDCGAAGGQALHLPPQSRRGLVSNLSNFLKRRLSAVYDEGDREVEPEPPPMPPVVLERPGLEAIFDALATAPNKLPSTSDGGQTPLAVVAAANFGSRPQQHAQQPPHGHDTQQQALLLQQQIQQHQQQALQLQRELAAQQQQIAAMGAAAVQECRQPAQSPQQSGAQSPGCSLQQASAPFYPQRVEGPPSASPTPGVGGAAGAMQPVQWAHHPAQSPSASNGVPTIEVSMSAGAASPRCVAVPARPQPSRGAAPSSLISMSLRVEGGEVRLDLIAREIKPVASPGAHTHSMEVDSRTRPSDMQDNMASHNELATEQLLYNTVHLLLHSLPRAVLNPPPPPPLPAKPPIGPDVAGQQPSSELATLPALSHPSAPSAATAPRPSWPGLSVQQQQQQAVLMIQLQRQGQQGSQQQLAAHMQLQALHQQQVHALQQQQLQMQQQQQQLQQLQQQQSLQQKSQQQQAWMPKSLAQPPGASPQSWPQGLLSPHGSEPLPVHVHVPGVPAQTAQQQPPIAATTPVALRPAAFASQIASALTLESLARSKPACGLSLKPKGVLLPTAPPGHSYAVGPRRGAYLVLQPVVDRDGTAVFPPPRPAHARNSSGRHMGRGAGRSQSHTAGRQLPSVGLGHGPPGRGMIIGPAGLPGRFAGMPHGMAAAVPQGMAAAMPQGMPPSMPQGVAAALPQGMASMMPQGITMAQGMASAIAQGVAAAMPQGMAPAIAQGAAPAMVQGVVPATPGITSGKPHGVPAAAPRAQAVAPALGHGMPSVVMRVPAPTAAQGRAPSGAPPAVGRGVASAVVHSLVPAAAQGMVLAAAQGVMPPAAAQSMTLAVAPCVVPPTATQIVSPPATAQPATVQTCALPATLHLGAPPPTAQSSALAPVLQTEAQSGALAAQQLATVWTSQDSAFASPSAATEPSAISCRPAVVATPAGKVAVVPTATADRPTRVAVGATTSLLHAPSLGHAAYADESKTDDSTRATTLNSPARTGQDLTPQRAGVAGEHAVVGADTTVVLITRSPMQAAIHSPVGAAPAVSTPLEGPRGACDTPALALARGVAVDADGATAKGSAMQPSAYLVPTSDGGYEVSLGLPPGAAPQSALSTSSRPPEAAAVDSADALQGTSPMEAAEMSVSTLAERTSIVQDIEMRVAEQSSASGDGGACNVSAADEARATPKPLSPLMVARWDGEQLAADASGQTGASVQPDVEMGEAA